MIFPLEYFAFLISSPSSESLVVDVMDVEVLNIIEGRQGKAIYEMTIHHRCLHCWDDDSRALLCYCGCFDQRT